eukprot:5533550-Prymnesium_polylepis.3
MAAARGAWTHDGDPRWCGRGAHARQRERMGATAHYVRCPTAPPAHRRHRTPYRVVGIPTVLDKYSAGPGHADSARDVRRERRTQRGRHAGRDETWREPRGGDREHLSCVDCCLLISSRGTICERPSL